MEILGMYLLIGLILVASTIGVYFEHKIDKEDHKKNRR